MSLVSAAAEMIGHLDTVVGALPPPSGGGNRLPDDVVVLSTIKKNASGIGKITRESAADNSEEHSGAFTASVYVHLWDPENGQVVSRSRAFIAQVLNLANQQTANGVFVKAALLSTEGPEFFNNFRGWQIIVKLTTDFEYTFTEAPGEGIIQEVTVDMEGEFDEDFTVNGE